MSDRFGTQTQATADDVDVLTGNQFGFEGEFDLTVDFYDEAPVSNELEHISKSRVKTYLKCPRSFAMKYLCGERFDGNYYTERGTMIHEAYEKFHENLMAYVTANNEVPHRFTELLGTSDDWFQFIEFLGPFFEYELDRLDESKRVADDFEQALEIWTPVSVEEDLNVQNPPVGTLPWLGPADVLHHAASVPEVEATEGVVVLDYKTGSLPKEQYRDTGIHIDLAFYSWMLEKSGFDVAGSIGLYPAADDMIVREVPDIEARATISRVVDDLHTLGATRDEFPTKPTPLCDYCEYQDQCDTSW